MTLRVLLVEDDPSWTEILTEMLEDVAAEICHAATFEGALEALEDGPYELALLDVSLATSSHDNQDGLRVLERFRARYPHTPAIILTGYATVDLAVQALTALHANDFLRKEQLDRRRFLEAVRRAVGTRVPAPRTVSPGPALVARPATEAFGVRVLVVEDNPAWQSIYEELLDEAGATMALAVSYGEARGLIQRGTFDAAVVDLKLASSTEPRDNRDGFFLLRLTREAGLPTLVVSALGQPMEIDRAYEEHGIFAFFDKEGFQRDAFLRTLRDAAHQRPPIPAAANGTVPPSLEATPLAELTERQLEVLALLAQGKTNNEIADEIIVSVNTVKKHVLAIFATLGVNTRAGAAAVAARYGMTDD